MVSTSFPIVASGSSNTISEPQRVATQSGGVNTDFIRILLAQMSLPDLSGLFASDDNNNDSSPFGGAFDSMFNTNASLNTISSLTGNNSLSSLSDSYGTSPLLSGLSAQMELSIWSSLIGKTVTSIDPQTNEKVSGKVLSVAIQNEKALLEIADGEFITPESVISVS
ncbi:MAG: hypothetical protein WC490_06825 [Candidatus Margulisiibacteriota bacterium]